MEGTLTEGAPVETGARADRKKLIFFVATDPGVDRGPLEAAYHFASVAAQAGLEAEVRLAAQAVRGLEAAQLEGPPEGASLTVCPRAMQKYGVSKEQVQAIGARPRDLAEILTEVAEGTSVLVPITHRIDDPSET